ncbi:MAG: VWA domain-containing protein [Bacteroidales bacterium]|nr:VWA domain-containing protein [Bacteroidales bacterium]
MRRLPVYLLLDTSGSMYGEPIEAVKNGVQTLVATLGQDPYALETAYLSIITFSNNAQQITPLTELSAFQQPNIEANGCTALGEALSLLANKVDTEVVKTTVEIKGDWKPLVFIMTDGEPTDSLTSGLSEFKKRKFGMVVACAAGQNANTNTLKQITENVVQLDTADSTTIKAFFKWVSASVSAGSLKVEDSGQEVTGLSELPPPPAEVNIVYN